jgi:simple sugar transport system permease protein
VLPETPEKEVAALAPQTAERGPLRRVSDLFLRPEATIFVVCIALIAYFAIRNSAFYSYTNIITMTQYIGPIAVIGAGETLLLDLAEIDLSSGQVFLTAPWFVVLIQRNGVPLAWAIVLALLLSVAIGVLNGTIVVWLKVPSFVTTLGVNYVLAGWVLVASSDITTDMVGTTGKFGSVMGISNWSEGLWGLGMVLVIWALLKGTVFGLHTTATGGNELGAAEAGVRVRQIKVWCFTIIAFVSAIAGIVDSVRIGSLDPAAPGLNEMLAGVTAAVIGGTALTGGKATVLGTLIGAIVLGVLEDGFNLIGISANWFILVEGAVILGAMAVNVQLGRVSLGWKRQ